MNLANLPNLIGTDLFHFTCYFVVLTSTLALLYVLFDLPNQGTNDKE